MNCVELHLGSNIIQIQQKNGQGKDLKDLSLVSSFLQDSKGYTVTVNGIEVNSQEYQQSLIQYLLNQIDTIKSNNQVFHLTSISQDQFIDNLIGTHNMSTIIGEESELNNNILYNSNWGSSTNWFGFTENRMIYVTGKYPSTKSYLAKSLYELYNKIKSGDTKSEVMINILYIKLYGQDETNIYQRLTRLANDKSSQLSSYLYINTKVYLEGKSISEYIQNNVESLKGMYFNVYTNDKPEAYQFVINNGKIQIKDKKYLCKNILTGKTEYVSPAKIKRLYRIISIYNKNNVYNLINNSWYHNNAIVDENTSDALFDESFGITGTMHTKIDLHKDDVTINSNIKTEDSFVIKTLNEILPVGSRVRTSSKIYVKEADGTYKFGDEILDENEKIYELSFIDSNNIASNISSLKNMEIEDDLSAQKLKVILMDYYDFNEEDIDSLWFEEDSDASTSKVLKSKNDKLLVKIKKYIKFNDQTLSEIHQAIKFYQYAKTNNFDKKQVKMYWNILIDDASESDLKNYDPVELTKIQEFIGEAPNVDQVPIKISDNITDMDDYMKQLIDLGIITISCEL